MEYLTKRSHLILEKLQGATALSVIGRTITHTLNYFAFMEDLKKAIVEQ